MMESLERAAKDIAQTHPEVILYGCTSGSFLSGVGREADAAKKIMEYTGIPGITTSTAVIDALKAVDASQIFMVTPYPDDISEAEITFLGHQGIKVVAHDSFRCLTVEALQKISSEQVAEMVLAHRQAIKMCDAVLISCTNLLTMDKIQYLERELGLPVISSNQATLWAGLRHLNVDTRGLGAGRLFELKQPTSQGAAVA
jgi:maleate isomerase